MWQPVYLSFLAEIVPADRLESAMGMSLSAVYTARTVGPALAGIVIAAFGTSPAFALNAATFVAPLIALRFIRTQGLPPEQRPSPLSALSGSVRSIRRDGVLGSLWCMSLALALFALPCLALVPVFATEVFHSGALGLGLLMTASGLGQLIGASALALGFLAGVQRSGLVQAVGYVAMGLLLIGFGASPGLTTAFATLLCFNFLHGVLSPRVNAIVQRRAAERGTAQALFLLVFGLVPVGQIALGGLATTLGAPTATLWFAAGFTFAAALTLVGARDLRAYIVNDPHHVTR